MNKSSDPTRRDLVKLGLMAGAGLALGGRWSALAATESGAQLPLLAKAIPSSGERVPAVGIGTNAYNLSAEMRPVLRDVMKRFVEVGGSVYDTATGYGRGESESVLGELHTELGNRDKLFLVTKIVAPENDLAQGRTLFQTSLERLKTDRIDGLLVHNLAGVEALIPAMQEWKREKKIRYLGISTSSDRQYEALAGHMKQYPLDLVQVDYSLGNRGAAETLLPLAADRGIGVMINVPFGGRRGANANFARLANVALPGWAADYDIKSWPQFFLKYVLSHPAVTMAIPGTRRVEHVVDNNGAARGRLPDAATRKKMEELFDSLPE